MRVIACACALLVCRTDCKMHGVWYSEHVLVMGSFLYGIVPKHPVCHMST